MPYVSLLYTSTLRASIYIYIYIYIFIYLFIYLFIRVYIYLLFIQKGYFIARGVLLSLGFGTRFPTRVFSPFHACLVPLNKLLVFFFSFTLSRRIVPSETLFLPCSFVSTIETCFSSSVNGNGDFEEEDDDDGNEEDGDVRSYLTY